jgi:UDP-glucose 4-epimerase
LARFEGSKVLVTGAAGFLGAHLCERLKRQKCVLFGIDKIKTPARAGFDRFVEGDLTLEGERLLQEWEPDVVFHLAGPASVSDSMLDPVADFDAAVPMTARLLAAAGRSPVSPKLVFFSSAAVYGEPAALPVCETDPTRPISPYGAHKAACEALFEYYARIYGLRVSILRIFSAFGAGLRRQFLWEFAIRALDARSQGATQVAALGQGDETRDFIHAEDIARAACLIAQSMSSEPHVDVVNVASGEETKIADVSVHLLEALRLDLEPQFQGASLLGYPKRWRADVSRLRALGFNAERTLEDEIPRLADWIALQHRAMSERAR